MQGEMRSPKQRVSEDRGRRQEEAGSVKATVLQLAYKIRKAAKL